MTIVIFHAQLCHQIWLKGHQFHDFHQQTLKTFMPYLIRIELYNIIFK